jgi:hypothetical protein
MKEIVAVVKEAHSRPFKLKSNFARDNAAAVAAAASLGWISTLVYEAGELYGDRWKVTRQGLKRLELETKKHG